MIVWKRIIIVFIHFGNTLFTCVLSTCSIPDSNYKYVHPSSCIIYHKYNTTCIYFINKIIWCIRKLSNAVISVYVLRHSMLQLFLSCYHSTTHLSVHLIIRLIKIGILKKYFTCIWTYIYVCEFVLALLEMMSI